jgi:hypothetical protein
MSSDFDIDITPMGTVICVIACTVIVVSCVFALKDCESETIKDCAYSCRGTTFSWEPVRGRMASWDKIKGCACEAVSVGDAGSN